MTDRCCSLPVQRRLLDSFPTRRSSDLFGGAEVAAVEPQPLAAGRADRCQADALALDRDVRIERIDRARGRVGEDRKSTRLNSSHSQTSYAAICLKKKTPRRTRARPSPR